MDQLTIDGSRSIQDRIEEASRLFGRIGTRDVAAFARFCRREGYLDSLPIEKSLEVGDAQFIKDRVFKKEIQGKRAWICTAEDSEGEWISRRLATIESGLAYCRMLKAKKKQVGDQLIIELEWLNVTFDQSYTEDDL